MIFLSNLQKFIDQAIAISCKLGTLWQNGNFASRQKLQNLVFPSGIYFDKDTDDYRTETENEVFKTFRLFSSSCKDGIEKATSEITHLSPLVEMERERNCDFIPPFGRGRGGYKHTEKGV